MVQRGYGRDGGKFPNAVYHLVQPERRRIRGVKWWRPGGVMGTAWGLENPGRARALYEERQDKVVVGVAGGHAPSDGPDAGCM